MNEDQVKQEVDKTLALLDTAPRARPKPFFYTRLKARMQTENLGHGFLVRLVHDRVYLAVVGLVLLVIINVFSFVRLSARSSDMQKEQTLASFAREYNLSHSQY